MKKLMLCCAIILATFQTYGQTAPYVLNEDHGSCCGGDAFAGSSFLTGGAGQIDSIQVTNRSAADYSGNMIYFYSGNTTNVASLLHSESVRDVHTSAVDATVMIKLVTPVHVSASTTYTFYVTGFATGLGYSDVYPNGTYWDDSGEHTDRDMDFIMYIGTVTTTGVINASGAGNSMIRYKSSERILEPATTLSSEYELSLYDVRGNLVAAVINKNLSIPSSLSQGVYIAHLQVGKVIYTTKVVLQ